MNTDYISQQKTILSFLMRGRVLTVSVGLRIAQTHDLRKHVSDLRKKGFDIISEWTTLPNKKRIKRYFLNELEVSTK